MTPNSMGWMKSCIGVMAGRLCCSREVLKGWIMNKTPLLLCGLLLSLRVDAAEVAGVILADSVRVGGTDLQLNGTGVKSKFFFDSYVAGLYLVQKQTVAENVISDGQVHRIALHLVRDTSGESLLEAFTDSIKLNHTPEELSVMSVQFSMLTQIFQSLKELKSGDIITFDYLPNAGTRISLNSFTRGLIPGPTFNRAVLRMWLGNKPLQEDMKKGLLGG
jgi:hypothetical protein